AQGDHLRQERRHPFAEGLFLQRADDVNVRVASGRRLTAAAAVLALAIIVVSQTATLAGVQPFASWDTPIAWAGFIIFADAVVYLARGRSWLTDAPGEFALLALVSIPLWIVFEGFNLVLRNWYYSGLTEHFWLRQFGFAWAFATIWPAIFEAAELVA